MIEVVERLSLSAFSLRGRVRKMGYTALKAAIPVGTALVLSACTLMGGGSTIPEPVLQPPVATQPPPMEEPRRDQARFLRPPHVDSMAEPVRIALLLPLSVKGEAGDIAQAMLDAAQLALFEFGNSKLLLVPKDTRGTPVGAEQAAREAIEDGAEIILGPLFSTSVRAVAPVAAPYDIPVVAFSTDKAVAGNGVYLLSFLPEQEIERVTDYAALNGITRFAAMIPQGEYGYRVNEAYRQAINARGLQYVQYENYPRNVEYMFDPARRLADYQKRNSTFGGDDVDLAGTEGALSDEQIAQINAQSGGTQLAYQAVLLPEGGTLLRGLAPLLPYFDVDPRQVKFLGTGLWDEPGLGREPSLVGGWFAAPAPQARQAFASRFAQVYGRTPPRLASLAYDAVGLAGSLAGEPKDVRYSDVLLTDENGFAGIDGIFRFRPDGSSERGLAVIEVKPNGFAVIDPAPTSFVPDVAF